MKVKAHQILSLNNENRNRRRAPEKLVKKRFKIKENEQEKQRAAVYVGTHTTLRCCFADAFGNPQKTGIIASIHTSIAAIAALPIAQGGYRNRILYSYHSVLLDIRLFTAAGRTGR